MAAYDDPRDEPATDPPPSVVSEADEKILKELRERFDYASTQKAPIIQEGDKDIRYTSGNTWDAADEAVRAGRPILNLDQLSQYTNQLVNSFRQNPRGAKASPAGKGATDKTADLRANRIRQIEHDSHAQEVYTVAGENAATRGYGYARIIAEYEDSESENQVLRLKAIPNPNQVIEDPDAESTSGADWRYLFFVHTISRTEFRRDYPDAQIKDFDAETIALAPRWFGKDGRVQIAEYWYVTETPSAKGKPKRTVCQYLTNGVELLAKRGQPKKTEWPGSSIPFASCYGKIIYQTDAAGNAQKMVQSYVRLARDAAKAYNWTKSTELEALALPVKATMYAYKGQLDQDDIALVERSVHEPIALIQASATTEATGQQVLPLPQFPTRSPDIQGYEIAAESYRRDVQNALGRYSVQDPRSGTQKVTSGVALQQLDKSGDLGSYHFVAHYDDMIRELAVKLNELLPHYDDTPKEVPTRLADGTTKVVSINTPTARAADGSLTYGPDDLRMDVGRHSVTISTGPSFDSQREAAKEAGMNLLGNPQAFPIIAADAVRLLDLGPIGDQMAKDLEFLQPPAMQQARQQEQGPGGAPDPRQLQMQMAQMKKQIADAEQIMQQQHGELQGKQADLASKEKIAQMEIASKERIAALDRETRITVAELGAKVERDSLFREERLRIGAHLADATAQASDQLHEAVQGSLDRSHDIARSVQDHGEALAAGQMPSGGPPSDPSAPAPASPAGV